MSNDPWDDDLFYPPPPVNFGWAHLVVLGLLMLVAFVAFGVIE